MFTAFHMGIPADANWSRRGQLDCNIRTVLTGFAQPAGQSLQRIPDGL